LGSATILVAKAGLLDGYSCVTHWRLHDEFLERFPNVRLTRGLYVIDRDRITSGGGMATFDLALAMVERKLGRSIATAIADAVLHPRIRPPTDAPRMEVPLRYGVTDTRIARAVESMEANIEQPLSLSLNWLSGPRPRGANCSGSSCTRWDDHQGKSIPRSGSGQAAIYCSSQPSQLPKSPCAAVSPTHLILLDDTEITLARPLQRHAERSAAPFAWREPSRIWRVRSM
jgi:hypothetical protein